MSEQSSLLGQKNYFQKPLGFYTLFWVFMIGCFLGVILEIAWFYITHHYYENRSGLVYGPFNLVYGLGVLGMTACLYWISKKSLILLFAGSCIVGSVFEFLCSWFQETMFGTVSWDYREISWNLGGRIHLSLSLIWGLLGIFWMKVLFPLCHSLLQKLPEILVRPLTVGMIVFMIINIVVSAAAMSRMSERHHGIAPENTIEEWVDSHFPDERMEKIFTNVLFVEGEERIPLQSITK